MLTKEETYANLMKVTEFKSLPPSQVEWLAAKGAVSIYPDGEKIFKVGDPLNEMRILFKGRINLYIEQGGNLHYFDSVEPFQISGRLPYSRMKGAAAIAVAVDETISYRLHSDYFHELITTQYELAEVLVHAMTDRVREFTKFQQQNDKMMALGKLSAGLAHELNNPSAAVMRGAQELKKHLSNLPDHFKGVIRIKSTDEVVDGVNDLLFSKINAVHPTLTLSEKTKQEDVLLQWLDDNDIDDGYLMAETFSDFGFSRDDMDGLAKILRPEDKNAVVDWLFQVLTTERLVDDIEEAARRINTLVSSIKSYTHMDQAPAKEPADIHEGIQNTLTLLNHKLKRNRVQVNLHFAPNLPKPKIYVSAMNQVWMNLIDNAIDALEDRENARLDITTKRDHEFVAVIITDNGPGIPKEIQDKIFDAFYTTKPVGKGTGLGLEIVRQIVSRHDGEVNVKSVPGQTSFEVCFPLNA